MEVLDAVSRADLPRILKRIPDAVCSVLNGRSCTVPTYACAMDLWERSEATPEGRRFTVGAKQGAACCFADTTLLEAAQALVQDGVLEELAAGEDGTRSWRWLVGEAAPPAPYDRHSVKVTYTTVINQRDTDIGRAAVHHEASVL